MSHTPGPWQMHADDECGGFVIEMGTALLKRSSYDGQHLVRYYEDMYPAYDDGPLSPGEQAQYDEAEANAHLIAAAPDLFAAVEALCDAIDDLAGEDWANIAAVLGGIDAQARTALRKARGETA